MSERRRATGRIGHRDWTKRADFRLLDANLDGSSRFSRPSAGARLAVAAAMVCGLAAAPATARAADPFGTGALVQQVNDQVNAALAQAGTAVPSAPAVPVDARQLVAQVIPRAVSAQPAPTTASSGSEAALALAAGAPAVSVPTPAPAAGAKTWAAAGPRPTGEKPRARRHHTRVHAKARAKTSAMERPTASPRPAPSGGFPSALGGGGYNATRTAIVSHARATATASARIRRAPSARPSRNAPAGVEPQRLPPVPLPPGPGIASPDQGGGQGSVMPLVVGAIAAAIVILGFPLLPRTLPRPAFRKPRPIAFPPWRPG
jgi:hypothetical protein